METIDPNEQNSFRKKLFMLEGPIEAASWKKLDKRIENEQKKKRRFLWWFLLVPVLVGLLWIFGSQDLLIRNQDIGKQKPEIRNQESGIRNQESEIRNQESGIKNQKSGKENSVSGKENSKVGKEISESGKEISVSGKENSKVGKENSESVRENSEPGREDSEAGRDISEAGKKDSESGREITEPGRENSKIGKENSTSATRKQESRERNEEGGIVNLQIGSNVQVLEVEKRKNVLVIKSHKKGTQWDKLSLHKRRFDKMVAIKPKSKKDDEGLNSVSEKIEFLNAAHEREENKIGVNSSKPTEAFQKQLPVGNNQPPITPFEEKVKAVMPVVKIEIPLTSTTPVNDTAVNKSGLAHSNPDTLVALDSTKKDKTELKNKIEIWTSAGVFALLQDISWDQKLVEYEKADLYKVKSVSNSVGLEAAIFGAYKINSYLGFRLGLGLSYWKQSMSTFKIPGIYAPVYYENNGNNPNELTGRWTESNVQPEVWSQQWLTPWLNVQFEGKPFKKLPFGARLGIQNSWLQGIGFIGEGQKSEGRFVPAFTFSLFYRKRNMELELKVTQLKQQQFGLAGRKNSEAHTMMPGVTFGYRF